MPTMIGRLLNLLGQAEGSELKFTNLQGRINVLFSTEVQIKNYVGTNTKSGNQKSGIRPQIPGAVISKKKHVTPAMLYRNEKRRLLRISEQIFGEELGTCVTQSHSGTGHSVTSKQVLTTVGDVAQTENSEGRKSGTFTIPQYDGSVDEGRTVAVAVTAAATDTAAVTELCINFLRDLWELANNFRIDIARLERADTNGEMVPIPPALTVRNWKKMMRTIKGSEDAEENRKVGDDGWINPIHPIQCKNDYLDIFYNWMANFDLGKCYWMVNDAADKAIPRPPAVHERIL